MRDPKDLFFSSHPLRQVKNWWLIGLGIPRTNSPPELSCAALGSKGQLGQSAGVQPMALLGVQVQMAAPALTVGSGRALQPPTKIHSNCYRTA